MSIDNPAAAGRPAAVYPIVRLFAAFALMTMGGSAMYAAILALPPWAAEFGVSRGTASMPYMLFMLGFGIGGVVMGRLADRVGIVVPALIAWLGLPAGLIAAAQATELWQIALAFALLCGLLGTSATLSPAVADISHWFDRRRGLAVGIAISGSYVAGAIWPVVLQPFIDAQGWRATFTGLGVLAFVVMLPLAGLLYRRAPADHAAAGAAAPATRPLGFRPATLQCLLCAAGVGCCVAMAMPQVHIVPYVTDLGLAAQRGAEMLSLMLGFGIISRLASGWISDRIGGPRTLLLGSFLQAAVLAAFLLGDTVVALYGLSIAFGLAQGGIVPSYAMIVRAYFPSGESGWRIGTTMLSTMVGMALGGWLAGELYDLTGSYTASFVNAVAFNLMNMAIAALLLRRARAAFALAG